MGSQGVHPLSRGHGLGFYYFLMDLPFLLLLSFNLFLPLFAGLEEQPHVLAEVVGDYLRVLYSFLKRMKLRLNDLRRLTMIRAARNSNRETHTDGLRQDCGTGLDS